MKFEWTHCEVVKGDINLRVLYADGLRSTTLGWVQSVRVSTGEAYVYRSSIWGSSNQIYGSNMQAMRALRRVVQMHIIGGGKLDGLRPT